MGRQGWLPVIESCRRITIRDIAGKDMMQHGCEWNRGMVWSSGFAVNIECRIDPRIGGDYDSNIRRENTTMSLRT